jgi:D-alanyl-D-alanine carboxypeptidase/D-alanyl-D-alanine-endopeptidase (penicillin-binding protein 4)
MRDYSRTIIPEVNEESRAPMPIGTTSAFLKELEMRKKVGVQDVVQDVAPTVSPSAEPATSNYVPAVESDSVFTAEPATSNYVPAGVPGVESAAQTDVPAYAPGVAPTTVPAPASTIVPISANTDDTQKKKGGALLLALSLFMVLACVAAIAYFVFPDFNSIYGIVKGEKVNPYKNVEIAQAGDLSISQDMDTLSVVETTQIKTAFQTFLEKVKDDQVSAQIVKQNGEEIVSKNKDDLIPPASNIKILTAYAAQNTLNMYEAFETKTILQGKTIHFVGDGDMLLSPDYSNPDSVVGRAGLKTLSDKTAKALLSKGIKKITLLYSNRFDGQDPLPKDIDPESVSEGYVTPLASYAINEGAIDDSDTPPHTNNPTIQTVRKFRDLLSEAGIEVAYTASEPYDESLEVEQKALSNTQGTQSPQSKGAGAEGAGTQDKQTAQVANSDDPVQLSSVKSANFAELLRFGLQNSDNTILELLGRMVGYKSLNKLDSESGTQSVKNIVQKSGFDLGTAKIGDLSGLGNENFLTAAQLGDIQAGIISYDDKRKNVSVFRDYPVSSVSGSLANRLEFGSLAGNVYAKTGSLLQVVALTGTLVKNSKTPISFSIIVKVKDKDTLGEARNAIDELIGQMA